MKKYNYGEIKTELEKRQKDNRDRRIIFEKVQKLLEENKINNIDKRILDLFKTYFCDTNFELFYHNENTYGRKQKYIRVYYRINNNNNFVDYNYYEDLMLLDNDNYNVYSNIETLQETCNNRINYCEEQEINYNSALKDLENKVKEFNDLMEKIDIWKNNNTELKYIMKVSEY